MTKNEHVFYGTERNGNALSVSIPQETLDRLNCETIVPFGDGSDLMVITRFGIDDYDVWFTDVNHLTDESYGSSARGSFASILDEIKEVL